MSDNVRDWIYAILKVIEVVTFIVLVCVFTSRWCRGDTVITDKPDGVNTRTRMVDPNGYVVSESVTLVHVPEKVKPLAEPSGEIPRLAWASDDRMYVALTPYEWESLTNRIAVLEATASRRLAEDYKTAAGRRIWHGEELTRKVNPDGLSVTWYYPDGFEYTEFEVRTNALRRARAPAAQKTAPGQHAPPPRPSLPPRLAEKREAMKSRTGRIREVNATFGPGGKVLKVEESK